MLGWQQGSGASALTGHVHCMMKLLHDRRGDFMRKERTCVKGRRLWCRRMTTGARPRPRASRYAKRMSYVYAVLPALHLLHPCLSLLVLVASLLRLARPRVLGKTYHCG